MRLSDAIVEYLLTVLAFGVVIIACGCQEAAPSPLMSCDQIAKAKEYDHVHFQAKISFSFFIDCTALSSASSQYCYIPISCGNQSLSLLLQRGGGKNNLYVPLNNSPHKKLTDDLWDFSKMEIKTADGKSATTGDAIEVEGELKKGKGLNTSFWYVDDPQIHSVSSTPSPTTSKTP